MNEEYEKNPNGSLPFTLQEIEILANLGIVPRHLLDPSKTKELYTCLLENKQKIENLVRLLSNEENYQIEIAPQIEWDKNELWIKDKNTGNIFKIQGVLSDFKLTEGVTLQIITKDIEKWEVDTAYVKEFNKEQHETLKAAIEKIGREKPLSRKEIVTLIEEIRKPPRKPKKYRQSGHLVDQKLKYKKEEQQLSIFDTLMPETQEKIEKSKVEVRAEGIKLTYAENKLVHALNQILYEKSQNSNPEMENFYSGNGSSELVPYGLPDHKARSPVIKFKPSDLYKAFSGTDNYSGADVKFIIDTLHQLESKKMLIKYDRVKTIKEGNKTKTLTDRIEDFQSLINIRSFIPDLSDEEKAALDGGDNSIRETRGEIIIALNPIFSDQIDTKYIEFPEDAQRRLVIAAGGHKKVTASMQILMEYMLREMSAKRYSPQINEDTLPYILKLDTYVKQKRRKYLGERIDKDIRAIMNMGIILRIDKFPNSEGGIKLVFHLNKDYE